MHTTHILKSRKPTAKRRLPWRSKLFESVQGGRSGPRPRVVAAGSVEVQEGLGDLGPQKPLAPPRIFRGELPPKVVELLGDPRGAQGPLDREEGAQGAAGSGEVADQGQQARPKAHERVEDGAGHAPCLHLNVAVPTKVRP